MEAYQAYKHKNHVASILMLSGIKNGIMLHLEKHYSAQVVWDAMKVQYGGISTIRLCYLTLKFDGYKKHHNHTMRQHLMIVSTMISELRVVGHEMTDEQQVQAVIWSLLGTWEHMWINLTLNDNIKKFDEVASYFNLEKDCLLTKKSVKEVFMTHSWKASTLVAKKKNVEIPIKAKGRMKLVLVDIGISMENVVIRKEETTIVSIFVN